MSSAREEILGRIRAALHDVPEGEQPADVVVAREYRRQGSTLRAELVERFIERVSDYKVLVQCTHEQELAQAIATRCAARNVHSLVVPTDFSLPLPAVGLALLRDDPPLSSAQLDQSDGVLTACALGIAQTGTIVLDGGAGQGRRALSLVPDYHLCVIFETQIVDLVPEAIARLADAVRVHGQPLTLISGPSATSDIELSRVEGVHGPRTLDVLVVRPAD
ncbi:MAG TPA: lactate utilization protein C [Ktedonobacteraceae bacterium]|jgi:L-lactate dehydrogenase complex protein LldG